MMLTLPPQPSLLQLDQRATQHEERKKRQERCRKVERVYMDWVRRKSEAEQEKRNQTRRSKEQVIATAAQVRYNSLPPSSLSLSLSLSHFPLADNPALSRFFSASCRNRKKQLRRPNRATRGGKSRRRKRRNVRSSRQLNSKSKRYMQDQQHKPRGPAYDTYVHMRDYQPYSSEAHT